MRKEEEPLLALTPTGDDLGSPIPVEVSENHRRKVALLNPKRHLPENRLRSGCGNGASAMHRAPDDSLSAASEHLTSAGFERLFKLIPI